MKRLYVGCRVRVVRLNESASVFDYGAIGLEGIINEIGCSNDLGEHGLFGVTLPIPAENRRNEDWCFYADELEPIQDPGRQVISWEEMAGLWTPEKVGA